MRNRICNFNESILVCRKRMRGEKRAEDEKEGGGKEVEVR
jgi:hypothetical protein